MTSATAAVESESGDVYAGILPPQIPKAELKTLSELRRAPAIAAIAMDWGLVALAVWLCETYWSLPLYALTVIWIGARFHALAILMHEATHYRLFANRKLNDWVGEVLLAWPILITVHGYRRNHFAHHRHVNTPEDPDWVRKQGNPRYRFPKSGEKIAAILLQYMTGLFAYREIKTALFEAKLSKDLPKAIVRGRMVFYAAVIGTAVYFGVVPQLLLYWIVPIFTAFLMFVYIRAISEHFGDFAGGTPDTILHQTRTVIPSAMDALLFFPHNINYHIEHHLYPSVPFYNLPRLHRMLMEQPNFRQNAHITQGCMTGLLDECRHYGVPPELLTKDAA